MADLSHESKPLLSTYLRERVHAEFGTLAKAAELHEIEYAVFRKSLSRNVFNSRILRAMFPETPLEELREKYTFRLTRGRQTFTPKAKFHPVRLPVFRVEGLSDDNLALIRENKAVHERILRLIEEECGKIREMLFSKL